MGNKKDIQNVAIFPHIFLFFRLKQSLYLLLSRFLRELESLHQMLDSRFKFERYSHFNIEEI